ncbi:hypothetical protein CLIB1423_10S00936 [[Candida] railenensis]|uniref:Uncharacterized protein n=1 Tax=[Candida] railenensis TaxID=45579 RepID=A0A9P0VYQ7_9ASCO|nr:hypothetical protein CLIB1423_10S00936 [[Candida] railenensis]
MLAFYILQPQVMCYVTNLRFSLLLESSPEGFPRLFLPCFPIPLILHSFHWHTLADNSGVNVNYFLRCKLPMYLMSHDKTRISRTPPRKKIKKSRSHAQSSKFRKNRFRQEHSQHEFHLFVAEKKMPTPERNTCHMRAK